MTNANPTSPLAGRPIAVEGSAIGALASWANGQDGWVRAVTSTVLTRRSALDATTMGLALHQLMAEKRLSDARPASAPTIEIGTVAAEYANNSLAPWRMMPRHSACCGSPKTGTSTAWWTGRRSHSTIE